MIFMTKTFKLGGFAIFINLYNQINKSSKIHENRQIWDLDNISRRHLDISSDTQFEAPITIQNLDDRSVRITSNLHNLTKISTLCGELLCISYFFVSNYLFLAKLFEKFKKKSFWKNTNNNFELSLFNSTYKWNVSYSKHSLLKILL